MSLGNKAYTLLPYRAFITSEENMLAVYEPPVPVKIYDSLVLKFILYIL